MCMRLFATVMFFLVSVGTFAQSGLKGEYYSGRNFNRKIFSRTDPQIKFNWDNRSPGPGMPVTEYSIRWTGRLTAPKSGEYQFSALVDDGIRVWVRGVKVLDAWGPHDHEQISGLVAMKEGFNYDIVVEYFNGILEGQIELFWEIPNPDPSFFDSFLDKKEVIGRNYFALPPAPNPEPTQEAVPVAQNRNKAVVLEEVATPKKEVEKPKEQMAIAPVQQQVAPAVNPKPKAPVAPKIGRPRTKMEDTIFKYTPKNILFEQGEPFIREESLPELDRLVSLLQRFERLKVSIEGHTDITGDPALNLQLSKDRASEVAFYLRQKGISKDRLSTTGYGSTRPLFGRDSTRLFPQNRRVEFKIR